MSSDQYPHSADNVTCCVVCGSFGYLTQFWPQMSQTNPTTVSICSFCRISMVFS
jgi:hypothetical protein